MLGGSQAEPLIDDHAPTIGSALRNRHGIASGVIG